MSTQPSPTPCPMLAGWSPTALPRPPAELVVVRQADGDVRVVNRAAAAIKVRFNVVTPGDCDRMPLIPDDFAAVVLAPGKTATYGDPRIVPAAGPVLVAVEVWTHACDAQCSDPPDAFVWVELRPG